MILSAEFYRDPSHQQGFHLCHFHTAKSSNWVLAPKEHKGITQIVQSWNTGYRLSRANLQWRLWGKQYVELVHFGHFAIHLWTHWASWCFSSQVHAGRYLQLPHPLFTKGLNMKTFHTYLVISHFSIFYIMWRLIKSDNCSPTWICFRQQFFILLLFCFSVTMTARE
jgi:hypothetical protein